MTRTAPALSTANSAASITYRTGEFVRGTWTGFNFPFDVSMVGTDNTISLNAGILRQTQPFENPEVICFAFNSGGVTVKNPAGRTVFTHGLRDGSILWKFGSIDVEISASLVPSTMVGSGSASFHFSFGPFGENAHLEFGSAVLGVVPTLGPGYARAAWNWPGRSRWFGTFRAQRRLASVLQSRANSKGSNRIIVT